MGSAGELQHIGLIHKFHGINVLAMLMAEVKDFLCLSQIQWSSMRVVTGTVAHRDQKFGADVGHEVQNPDPLFVRQNIRIMRR